MVGMLKRLLLWVELSDDNKRWSWGGGRQAHNFWLGVHSARDVEMITVIPVSLGTAVSPSPFIPPWLDI